MAASAMAGPLAFWLNVSFLLLLLVSHSTMGGVLGGSNAMETITKWDTNGRSGIQTSADTPLQGSRWWALHDSPYTRLDFDAQEVRGHFTRQQWASFSARKCGFDPEAVRAALRGVSIALRECERQMSTERWNCSRLPENYTPGAGNIFGRLLRKGIPETAFALAVVSAGVTASIASECRRSLRCCPCKISRDAGETPDSSQSLPAAARYAGCDHNSAFAGSIGRKLLDRPESGRDVRYLAMLHNFNAGRRAVAQTMGTKCVCHGTSGSCVHRICWRVVASFQTIGEFLKRRYKNAVKVEQASPVNIYLDENLLWSEYSSIGRQRWRSQQHRRKQQPHQNRRRRGRRGRRRLNLVKFGRSPQQPGALPRRQDLVYYESVDSDFFCEPSRQWSLPGVHSRVCNVGRGNCSSICCTGTYRVEHYKHVDNKCNCRFVWCCEVKCQTCVTDQQRQICD